jgi:hypothetical protein
MNDSIDDYFAALVTAALANEQPHAVEVRTVKAGGDYQA